MSLLRTEIDLGAKLEVSSAGPMLLARLSSERAKWLGKRAVATKGRSIKECLEKLEEELRFTAKEEAQRSFSLPE